jgi:hypothetical protein
MQLAWILVGPGVSAAMWKRRWFTMCFSGALHPDRVAICGSDTHIEARKRCAEK